MDELLHYIKSNQDSEFKDYQKCLMIVQNNKKENFNQLCLSIQQFLDTNKSRHLSQFSILKLCLQFTILESNEEFLFGHYQNIILPSIINYIYNNQMYSKDQNLKAQQYIHSSVTLAQELVSFLAHTYPQTKNFQTSKFLSEYQFYKKQQRDNLIAIKKKQSYKYFKEDQFKIDQNYKQIKKQWKSSNFIQDPFISDDETVSQQSNPSIELNGSQQQIEPNQQNISQEVVKETEEFKQLLKNLKNEIEQKQKELKDITDEVDKKKEELQQIQNKINQTKSTITSESNQSNACKIFNSSFNGKQIFDPTFNFDCEKQYSKLSDGTIPLVSTDTSYPEKKKRLLDGKGIFHIGENYLLARQLKFNQNTIDIAIYLKCIQNSMSDLKIQITCEDTYQINSNLNENKNLKSEQQVKFEIRDIPKSKLYEKDIKIELTIDSLEILQEQLFFYLKLTNIVNYNYENENELVKEYQNISNLVQSKPFGFDDETFPNGLLDVQKCIPYSINYIDQAKSLFLSGSINDKPFICRITLDSDKQAQVSIKKLQFDEELTRRLVVSYCEALKN